MQEIENSVSQDLDGVRSDVKRLQAEVQERDNRLEDLEKQRRTLRQQALDSMSHLESNNKQHLMQINEYTSRIHQAETEKDAMLTQLNEAKNKRENDADTLSRELRDATRRGEEAKAQTSFATEQKNAAEEQVRQGAQRVVGLQEELDRLRRQVQELQQQSADNEVKRVQMSKQREKDMEDISGLNMALDSKQQELELVSVFFSTIASCAHRCVDEA